MKTLPGMTVGVVSLLGAGATSAQNSNMMNGGFWNAGWMGGYGGMWMPILFVVVVAGLVAWIVKRSDK